MGENVKHEYVYNIDFDDNKLYMFFIKNVGAFINKQILKNRIIFLDMVMKFG